MAFPNHLSQEMGMQHFSEHHLGENSSVLRTIIPEEAGQSSASQKQEEHHQNHQTQPPSWLSQYSATAAEGNMLNLRNNSESSEAANQWLSRSILQRNVSEVREEVISHESGDMSNGNVDKNGGREIRGGDVVGGKDGILNWHTARYKAEILSHPLYQQLLSAHVACLRIATPVDQLPRIDAQLTQSQNVVAKYSGLAHGDLGDHKEIDQFMHMHADQRKPRFCVSLTDPQLQESLASSMLFTHYFLLLCSFKEQLQQHVRVHAMEAVMACWEIEQSLQSLTGVSPGEGTGATMSDDEDDQVDSDANLFDGGLESGDNMGFGPLVPTESERSLMERVRQELKHELKQGYKEKIVDIREEILRKRRAGKLPGDTTSVLKEWWQTHSKWPYPTEEDKARLVQETGLQLKQINNWFINQRKRNWHSNPSSSTALKNKRKR